MLPWFEHARQGPESPGIADCGKCYKATPKLQRQTLGCGFEPPPPMSVPVVPWDHRDRTPDASEYADGKPVMPICPGYVCRLPQVMETARAYSHWTKGALPTFVRGMPPNDQLNDALEILDGAVNRLQARLPKKPSDTGGGS